MGRLNNRKGFTLAETLLVVAIMTVLAGVSFVAVQNYLRSMTKLEYDSYAKEIFIAAQNHLSMAKNLSYLGMEEDSFGTEETGDGGGTGVYYYVVNTIGGRRVTDKNSLLSLMLPTAAVDETVRLGGKYIIRYRPEDATVLDVFYWSDSGRYALSYEAEDYQLFLSNHSKETLKTFGADKSVVGWYGGEQAALLDAGTPLQAPAIVVRNAERLTVTVTDPNENDNLRLIVRGVSSGGEKTINLKTTNERVKKLDGGYQVVLDDITSNLHFSRLVSENENSFIPGEDIEIQVLAEPDGVLGAPAYSATATTNSLFGDGSSPGGRKAEIDNIRHLENLCGSVSNVSTTLYSEASQSVDLSWTEFKTKINAGEPESVRVIPHTGSPTNPGCFLPVTPGYVLEYEGNSHKIREVRVNTTGAGGLFGSLNGSALQPCGVANLMLVDFSVTGTNAGALAGSADSTTVNNVLAYNTGKGLDYTITGTGSVGGLIGSLTGGWVTNSAAALMVSGGSSTGGLIGAASGAAVNTCYAGAHTVNGGFVRSNGSYLINVSGSGSAGGLIGKTTGGSIVGSYSTCSVSGYTAGGLVGSADGRIESCYSVGLVQGTTKGVFLGSSTATCADCAYLDVVGYYADDIAKYIEEEKPRAVGSGSVGGTIAMDSDARTFNAWYPTSAIPRPDARPYDGTLERKYPYRAYALSGVFAHSHYGDWPDVNTYFINTK